MMMRTSELPAISERMLLWISGALSGRRPARTVAALVLVAAWLIGAGEGMRTATAQCVNDGVPCPENAFEPIVPVGCVTGCDNPWGSGPTQPNPPGAQYHGPTDYSQRGIGKNLGDHEHMSHAKVTTPTATNRTTVDHPDPNAGLPAVGDVASQQAQAQRPAAITNVPTPTGPPPAPAYPGDPAKPPTDEPVDHRTGEFILDHVDMQFPGFGVPFILVRTYGSRRAFNGPMGAATDHSYNLRLVPSPVENCAGNLLFMTGQGQTIEFQPGPMANDVRIYSAPDGVQLELKAMYVNGTLIGYWMKRPDGTVATFDLHGFILSMLDPNDQGLHFTWDVRNERLDGVHDSAGRDIAFTYDAASRVTRVSEKRSGLHADYVYDDATGELLQVTDASGQAEVYEYQHYEGERSDGYIPEPFLVDACEQACAPSATSCHAGGACEGYGAVADAACRQGCSQCLPNCVNECNSQCDAGADLCRFGDGTAAHPGCDSGCKANCPTLDQAVPICNQLFDTPNIQRIPPPLGDPHDLISPHDACWQATLYAQGRNVDCSFLTPEQCDKKGEQAHACLFGDQIYQGAFHVDCGCTKEGATEVCHKAFMGEVSGTCGCDSNGHCPSREELGGCPTAVRNECVRLCDDSCTTGCVQDCKSDCAVHQCLPSCDVPSCNAECDGTDFEQQCNDTCVSACVNKSHSFTGSRTEAPRYPEGPKYGYPEDLNHNLVRIFNADGQLRLENTYGDSIGDPSFDAIITQRVGTQTVTFGYRDYAAENGIVTSTPAHDPSSDLTVTAPTAQAISASARTASEPQPGVPWSHTLATQYTVPFASYETADLCPERCMRSPTVGPALDYVPTPDGIVAVPQVPGHTQPGGLISLQTIGGGGVPTVVFPLLPGGGGVLNTQPAIGGNPSYGAWPTVFGQPQAIGLRSADGSGSASIKRNSNNTLTISGPPAMVEPLRGLGELTIMTDARGYLHIYPGRPQSFIFLAAGTCTDAFRAQLNSAGQLQLTAYACGGDLSVSPMGSLVSDASARASFLSSGSSGLASRDLLVASALLDGRWVQRWRAVPQLLGRYELSVGAGEGAAPSMLAAKIATLSARSLLVRPISSADAATRPFYVFHLPEQLRPTTNTSAYAWDKAGAFDAREVRTDCTGSVIDDPVRGHGFSGPGPRPASATVVMDAYGVPWTFYYDEQGEQIRMVNQGTLATRSFNYDHAHQLVGVEDPVGVRECLKYDGSGNLVQTTTLPAPNNAAADSSPIRQRWEYQTNPSRVAKVFDPRDPARVMTSYTWDAKGNILTKTDALGAVATYTPSEFGPPSTGVAPSGARTTVAWDAQTGTASGTTADATGESPVTVTTDHDGAGHPTHRVEPLGATWDWHWNGATLDTATHTADGQQEIIHYTYDDNNWPRLESNGRYQITMTRDVMGNLVRQESTALDGTAAQEVTCRHVGFDGRLIEEVRPEGLRIKRQYDGEGRVVAVTAGFLPHDPTATWDQGCIVPAAGPEVDPTDIGKSYDMGHVTYDDAGRILVAKDAFGAESRFQYDGYGRPIISTDASGNSVRVGYDALGHVIWRATYDGSARDLAYRHPDLGDPGLMAVVEFQYDEDGRIQQQAAWHFDANHQFIGDGRSTTTYVYDPVANSVTMTDDAGASTTQFYDGAGRLTKTVLPTQDRVEMAYKTGGHLVVTRWSAPTPSGYTEREAVLNESGLPAELYVGDGLGTRAKTRTLAYDNGGRLVTSTGPLGLDFEAIYDAFGRPSTTTKHFDDTSQERVTYLYNRDGRVLARTSDIGGHAATTRAHYDSLGRVLSSERPDLGKTSNTYVRGSTYLLTSTDPRGTLWVFDHYENGELAGIAAMPSPNPTHARARRFTYDGLGRLIEARDKGADFLDASDDIVTTLQWDSLNNKTLEWDTSSGQAHAVSHQYDGRGLPVASSFGPYSLVRTYDALGREDIVQAGTTVLARFAYRGLGGPVSRTLDSGAIAQYSYDVAGRVEGIAETRDSVPLATWRYEMPLDGVPRLAGLRKGSGAEVASIFQVDRAGRLLGEEHALSGLDGVRIEPLAPPTAPTLGSLPSIGQGTNWRTYTLDGRSNWTNRNASNAALRTTPSINSLDGYDNFGGTAASWDAGGNLQSLGNETYTLDDFGELTGASNGANRREFTRDAFGRIVRERDPQSGAVTKYTFDGARRAAQVNADGSWLLAVDGEALDEHIALVPSTGARRYLHQDRERSVYLVTDEHANPIEWTGYTAYGEADISDALGQHLPASAVGNRFGFQGQPYYASLGLVDMRSRFYRPAWGRFIATDAIGLAGGPNLYAFVGAAPLLWRDPMGFGKVQADAGVPADAAEPYDEPPKPVERTRDGVRTPRQIIRDRDEIVKEECKFNQIMWAVCKPLTPCVGPFILKAQEEDRGMSSDEATAKELFFLGATMFMPGGEGGPTFGGLRAVDEAGLPLTPQRMLEMEAERAVPTETAPAAPVQGAPGTPPATEPATPPGTETPAAPVRRYSDGSLRTPDGKFASPSGEPAPGTNKASEFMNHLRQNGMDVVGEEVTVNTPFGQRRYDGVVRGADGKCYGIEIKSGGAGKTMSQDLMDLWVDQHGAEPVGPYTGTGRIQGTVTVHVP